MAVPSEAIKTALTAQVIGQPGIGRGQFSDDPRPPQKICRQGVSLYSREEHIGWQQ